MRLRKIVTVEKPLDRVFAGWLVALDGSLAMADVGAVWLGAGKSGR